MESKASRLIRVFLATVLAMTAAMAGTVLVAAHEHREVGDYEITIGFMNEPAYVEEPNGLDLVVRRTGDAGAHSYDDDEDEEHDTETAGHSHDGEGVEGLVETLNSDIIFGNQEMPLTLRAVWNQPGAYTADVIPTAEGTYSFRVYGEIEGTEVDETFVGGPTTFSEVEARDGLAFPGELDSMSLVSTTATDANSAADSARMFGIAGVVLGALGLIAGVAGFVTARNARPVPAGSEGARGAPRQARD